MIKDYASATESHKRALNIRQKVLGEGHAKTADSYHKLGLPKICLKTTPWVKIMRILLTATMSWGLPKMCFVITPQPLSHKS